MYPTVVAHDLSEEPLHRDNVSQPVNASTSKSNMWTAQCGTELKKLPVIRVSVHGLEPKTRAAEVYRYFISKIFTNHSIIIESQ